MSRDTELARAAHGAGRNVTKQREAILAALRAHGGHPTAQELFDVVRQDVPAITLATVYRNLRVLTELGLVAEVKSDAGPTRYDETTRSHWHVRCASCGRLGDVPGENCRAVLERAQGATEFRLTGCRVTFTGICPQCQDRRTAADDERRDARCS